MAKPSNKGVVYYSAVAYTKLNEYLDSNKPSKVFVLVDGNTHEFCLSKFLSKLEEVSGFEIIEIPAGEENKNLETCSGVWNALSELGADRKSLLINVGGGVVTDLGGFVASTFKRGIEYINVPTSLLSMVDASVGGKTGVDLGNLKNQIGVINYPEMVIIDSDYLDTLPKNEMRSGLAEILKHGLIKSESYWHKVSNLANLDLQDLDEIIKESVDIKAEVVTKDPFEKNTRKTLNFGHTLGHAIESYFLTHNSKEKLLHGEAVAAGMVLATFISQKLKDFPKEKLKQISSKIFDIYGKIEIDQMDIARIIDLMKYDKKNERGNVNFVLLKDIGEPEIDCLVANEIIYEAFEFYQKT
ncbi:3-dehydroquinate synthase [Salegentibacter sp. F188]|uniref:3-dehydroquinate synthase n=1 Tax=Autumnicola patrickiae TaxID=3075591 RepID=A0ABU3E3N9_9FLAO|nr:3-dehydroquinate synthase [Salegentibacter sp. F188]MDT0690594.1 3-dehydroquinate synthase [Salegentibacter sp. F188]